LVANSLMPEQKTKFSSAAQARISSKVSKLINSGEYPNTENGRKQAHAVAMAMERAGNL
jgi:hypothetical protein